MRVNIAAGRCQHWKLFVAGALRSGAVLVLAYAGYANLVVCLSPARTCRALA